MQGNKENKHWSQYWQYSKSLNSFAEGEAGKGYQGEIAAFWQKQVKDLEDQAVIVDVGTGNGALAVLIAASANALNVNWQIHGVDYADIDPAKTFANDDSVLKQLQGITFHGNTNMNKLPFEDASVDCVVSQFALEYADHKAALTEAHRVLKPGGKLIVMAHHADSVLTKDSARGKEIFDYVLNNSPLFIQADLLLRLAAERMKDVDFKTWKDSQECNALGKSVEWTLHVINERFPLATDHVWLTDIFNRVINVLNHGQSLETAVEAQRRLSITYDMLQGHLLRVQDQVNAAFSAQEAGDFEKLAKQFNTAELAEFNIDNELFAWGIHLIK